MADTSYTPNVYREQGANRFVIASGGSCDVESGGEIDVESGGALKIAGTDVTSEVAALSGLDRAVKVVKVALADSSGNAGILSWQNPESSAILVQRVLLDVTTQATGAANVDVGTDGDGTGSSDNLIDGADIGSAAALLDNIDDQGTNGKARQRLDENGGTTDYITATGSADPAGLVGSAYIEYVVV